MTTAEIVDKILAGTDVRSAIKESIVIEESFTIGSYIKFNNDVSGYFMKDQRDDVHLVFEMPIDGLVGKLNNTTTFKLIGYNGDTAKIVAMVNDIQNGNKSGEIYFVSKADLNSKAKSVQPRSNKQMNGKYTN